MISQIYTDCHNSSIKVAKDLDLVHTLKILPSANKTVIYIVIKL